MSPRSIQIGGIALGGGDEVFTTVLGSCISVCLYCPSKAVGGLIHYSLPTGEPKGTQDMRFANVALPRLIRELSAKAGVPANQLLAKVVGGADVVESLGQSRELGDQNYRAAARILAEYQIRIAAIDVNGTSGRQIYFYPATGRLRVAKTPSKAAVQAKPTVQVASPLKKKRPRVLIVDDSKTIQELLTRILSADPELEVIGRAPNAIVAEKMIQELKPDVLTLDIHMPEISGIEFLEKIMPVKPMPVVMISSISMEEGPAVLRALELGAVDYIQKPSLKELAQLSPLICEKVRHAAEVRVRKYNKDRIGRLVPKHAKSSLNTSVLVAIGASTGGTEALKDVLVHLPAEIPPIVVVQHIPPVFSAAFAKRLNELCPFEVKEAEDGDLVVKNRVLIAPGGKQMAIETVGGTLKVRLTDDPPVSRHKPSVDYLFSSVAKLKGRTTIAAILTGMGSDGARGMLELKNTGARTMAQDEASCVVFGMPKVAIEMGGVDEIHPLEKIPEVLVKWLSKRDAA